MPEHHYKAYLSYSHEDTRWATWLHRALEAYRVPARLSADVDGELPRRLAPIFRDRDDLSSGADLASTLGDALEHSEHLIVICSPASANSRWVNEEIRRFRALGRSDHVHCMVVDGEPGASPEDGGCFPPALFEDDADQEPLAADPREFADGKRLAMLKIAAGLLGVRLDALRRRDHVRQRRLKLMAVAASVAVIALVGLAISARLAEQEERARAEQMAAFIVDLGEDLKGDIDLESLARMSSAAMGYLDQLDPDRLSVDARLKVGKALRQVGNVNWHQGELAGALEAFERSRQLFEKLTGQLEGERSEESDEAWFQLSQSEFYVGYLLAETGDTERAKPHFDRYLEIAETQSAARPDDHRWLLEVSYANSALVNIGLSLQEAVDEEVLAAIQENLDLARRVMETRGRDEESVAHFSNELAFASDAYADTCRLRQALEVRQESLAISKELLAASGQSVEFEIEVALRERGLAGVLRALGQLQSSKEFEAGALETFRTQHNRDPSNETNITDLALAHRRIGRLLMEEGNLELAREHQGSALELLQPIVDRPQILTWQQDEYRVLILERARLERLAGNLDEALALLDTHRVMLTSQEAGETIAPREVIDRVRYRYERWLLTGTDPAMENSLLLANLPVDQGSFTSCQSADLLARHGFMTGDLTLAERQVIYLEEAEYRDPGYLAFCLAAGLCSL